MNAVVVLEWTFSPPDYFEEAIEISRQDYTMTIADGQAHAKIDSVIYEANPNMREELQDVLNAWFFSEQVQTHRVYELSRPKIARANADGSRVVFIDLQPAHIVASAGIVDFRVTDKDGNVIVDSKRDRTEERKRVADLITSHRATDTLLASLLRSYDAAIRDPNDGMVHLYEIRDALSMKFGNKAERTALGIRDDEWNRFGRLCNDEQLRQGRHRGKTGGALRDATDGELIEARCIALAMIEAYLRHS